jgi:hypothetical protein
MLLLFELELGPDFFNDGALTRYYLRSAGRRIQEESSFFTLSK